MNKKIIKGTFVLMLLVVSALVIQSCKKDSVPKKSTPVEPAGGCADTIKFSTVIGPMINTNCASCHGQGAGTLPLLDGHATISANAANILSAIKGDPGFQQMPQGGPFFDQTKIDQFSCWMVQGKLNN